MSRLAAHIHDKRIVICCGAGGVGKTTTSAALAVAAAQDGRRVLVLTIDPSKRLAEALGVTSNTPDPVRVRADREIEAGIHPPGALSAWMLDPKLVSDATVRRLVRDPKKAQELLNNPIYQQVTQMIAGMQEDTAMEALHGFVERGEYDLVILDTPPARNALNFLDAPRRLGEFLDGRIFQMLLPDREGKGPLGGTTRMMAAKILSGVFGDEFYNDLQVFFSAFHGIFAQLNGNAQKMRVRMQQDDVVFLLVTSPVRTALDDALYFEDRIRELDLPLGGLILNRSRHLADTRPMPDPGLLPPRATEVHRAALAHLTVLAERERKHEAEHRELLSTLVQNAPKDIEVLTVPEFPGGIDDLRGLGELARWMLDEAHAHKA